MASHPLLGLQVIVVEIANKKTIANLTLEMLDQLKLKSTKHSITQQQSVSCEASTRKVRSPPLSSTTRGSH